MADQPKKEAWGSRLGVILAVAGMFVVPSAMFSFLQTTGFFRAYYGEDPPDDPKSDLFRRCFVLWAQTLADGAATGTMSSA